METLDYHRLGASIHALRKARNISQTELAKAIGLKSPRAISELESGTRELRGSEIHALCEKLECTLAELFGLETSPFNPSVLPSFRGNKATSAAIKQLVERLQRQGKLMTELEAVVDVHPSHQLPDYSALYPASKSVNKIREQAVALAARLRSEMGLGSGPIANLEEILEDWGMVYASWEMPEGISGLSLRCAQRPHVVISDSEHALRQRFTLAHELAHAVVDAGEQAVLTRSYGGDNPRGFSWTNNKERRADHFAGAFLMPEAGVYEYAAGRFLLTKLTPHNVMDLAAYFGITGKAAAITLAYQGILTSAQYTEMEPALRSSAQRAPASFLHRCAGELKTSERMLRLGLYAMEQDIITESRLRELLMTDRQTLYKLLEDSFGIETSMETGAEKE